LDHPLGNIPLPIARLWLAYNFGQETVLDNFGLGAGLRYESERPVQFDTTIMLDEFVVV